MTVNITIRNVPAEVKNELASRAALEGKSMQEYLSEELVRIASKPNLKQWVQQVRERQAKYNANVSTEAILEAVKADRK